MSLRDLGTKSFKTLNSESVSIQVSFCSNLSYSLPCEVYLVTWFQMQGSLWIFFIPGGILLGVLGPQSVLSLSFSSVSTVWWIGWVNVITKFWLRMARFLLYIVVWLVVIGLLPMPAGMWHFGGNLQCCSPYLCPEPFISSSFESSCFCKMSAHTSEADLLFLPVKPFSFSSYFLLVMRPSTL